MLVTDDGDVSCSPTTPTTSRHDRSRPTSYGAGWPLASDIAFVQEWRRHAASRRSPGDVADDAAMAGWLEERLREDVRPRSSEWTSTGYAPTLIGTLDGPSPSGACSSTHTTTCSPRARTTCGRRRRSPLRYVGESVVARGCCDDKADITARLGARPLARRFSEGRPPYTIVWLSEGAEEVGSPGLDEPAPRPPRRAARGLDACGRASSAAPTAGPEVAVRLSRDRSCWSSPSAR